MTEMDFSLAKENPSQKKTVVPKNKFILDATAGFRMMHFNKNRLDTVYFDIRTDIQLKTDLTRVPNRKPWQPTVPTFHGNFCSLPFPDESFHLVIFDPPHFTQLGDTGIYIKKFGKLQAETWPSEIKRAAIELWRVLKPFGILILKWNDHVIHYKKILRLFPEKPIVGQITAGGQGRRKGIPSHTFWFTFMKIPKEVSE